MSLKLIVLGSVNGRLSAAFQKIAALHAKNNFACCIATGNLFGVEGDGENDRESAAELDRLLAGQIPVPVSTYFTVGTRPFPAAVAARLAAAARERAGEEKEEGGDDGSSADGAELCPNLTFLGRRSVTKTVDGLRIVALGGVEVDAEAEATKDDGDDDNNTPWRATHTRADAAVLRGAHRADVLLTALWPRGVWRGSRVALPGEGGAAEAGIPASDAVADLAVALRPRYHLTAAPPVLDEDGTTTAFFYEREPFAHPPRTASDDPAAPDVTRFLALAPWANPAKAKALYAFALQPNAPATAPPPGCTASPFPSSSSSSSNPRKRAPLDPEPYSRFSQEPGRGGGGGGGGRGDGRRGGKRRRMAPPPPPGPDQCYFCLSNPNLPTHMVCSIGNDAYLATAKGPLPEASTWKEQGGDGGGLNFPGHMLIVPLNHAPTLAVAPTSSDNDDEAGHAAAVSATRATFAEMTRFRRALQALVAGASGGRLGAVTWEISRQRNVHVHWQTVPVPVALAADGLVAAAFRVEATNLGLPAVEETTGTDKDDLQDQAVLEGDTFRVWIWTPDGRETTLVQRLDPAQRFDLQLGRRVVAKLLGLEATRAVWQECAQSEAEETADVAAFREAFAPYDFTLED